MPPHNALVTGAAHGIGRALALRCARQGQSLTLVDLDIQTAALEAVAAEAERAGAPTVAVRLCDVTNPKQLDKTLTAHGTQFDSLDLLINNAGIAEHGNFVADEASNWRAVTAIDLDAVIHGTQAGIRVMRDSGRGGTIINVSSAGGLFPMPFQPVYSAAKAGVVMFTRSCQELRLQDPPVAVRALCPQFVDTRLVHDAFEAAGDELAQQLVSATGGRLITVDELAEAAGRILDPPPTAELPTPVLLVTNELGGVFYPKEMPPKGTD